MKNRITNKDFELAQKRLNVVTQRGGFQFLTFEEEKQLAEVTRIVKLYEDGAND